MKYIFGFISNQKPTNGRSRGRKKLIEMNNILKTCITWAKLNEGLKHVFCLVFYFVLFFFVINLYFLFEITSTK